MSDERCENCRFWLAPKQDLPKERKLGNCRRYPLTTVKIVDRLSDLGNAQFPRIRSFGWCGEWQSIVTDEIREDPRKWIDETSETTETN